MTNTHPTGLEPLMAPARSGVHGLLLVLGLIGAAVVAGLAAWSLGAAGDDTGPSALADDPSFIAESGDDEASDPQEADEPIPLPLVTYELFLARDPFEPVVPDPVPAAPAPGEPTDPADPTAPPAPDTPPTTPPNESNTNGNSTANENGACTGTIEVVCNGRVLSVIEIAEENGELVAVIEVDTMRYRVGVGDVFADNFQVVSISPNEVRILFGDRVSSIEVGDNALK